MSYEIPGGLPTLAHPLIATPTMDAENDEPGIYLPPYPCINLNWKGFSIAHLHWLGLKQTGEQMTDLEHTFLNIHIQHEMCHGMLAYLPFSLVQQVEILQLYDLIAQTFLGRVEQIPVPLSHDLARNEIEKKWAIWSHLYGRSALVQEVFAVCFSLRNARKDGLISPPARDTLATDYKTAYMKWLPDFPWVYNAFDFVVRHIGETAALMMVLNTFGTSNPSLAFVELLASLCVMDSSVPTSEFVESPSDEYFQWAHKVHNPFKNLSTEQSSAVFQGALDHFDPDGSRFARVALTEYGEKLYSDYLADTQHTTDDMKKLLFGHRPMDLLFTLYTNHFLPFYKLNRSTKLYEEFGYGHWILCSEAIPQQLVTGIGLLCPFWRGSCNDRCCSDLNRMLLESVWEGTADSAGELWRRQGCLAKDGGAL